MRLLVIYDRSGQMAPEYREFGDGQSRESVRARIDAENQHRDNPAIEVVVLYGESRSLLEERYRRLFPRSA